jgi:hypothetical protein
MKHITNPGLMERWKLASCSGKVRYTDGRKAAFVLSKLSNQKNGPMTYRCPLCGGWHIGRKQST